MKRLFCALLCLLSVFAISCGTIIDTRQQSKKEYMAGETQSQSLGVATNDITYGDVDGDGEITSSDAFSALRISVFQTDDADIILRSDVDGDGQITTSDALLILQYSIGTIDRFPVQSYQSEQSGNSQNGGLAVKMGQSTYYTDLTTGIYKYNDGIQDELIIEGCFDSLCTDGGYLYYVDFLKGARAYRADPSGSSTALMIDSTCANLIAEGGILYYINIDEGGSLCCYNTRENTARELCDEMVSSLRLYENRLYYITHTDSEQYGEVTRLDLASGQILGFGKYAYKLDVYEGEVYYTNVENDSKIYKISTDGGDNVRFCNYPASRINVYDGTLYFTRSNENNSIYELRCDKSYIDRLLLTNADYICAADGRLYYTDGSYSVYSISADGSSQQLLTRE